MASLLRSKIFPILMVNFIGILGYSVVIPILIYIVTDFGGNGFIYGILGAMYPFFQFIGAPILGKLSDRIGRKKVLIISQAGTFLAWSLFILAFLLPETDLWSQESEITGNYVMTLPLIVIFIARIFDGFTGGNVSVANAYLSDISDDENRNSNFGKMGASTSLGFVLGPAVAGLLATTFLEELLPIIIAAIISLIAIFVIHYRLEESNPCAVDTRKISLRNIRRFFQVEHKDCYTEGEEEQQDEDAVAFKRIIKISGIPLLFSIYFLTFFAFSLFYAGLPIYANTLLDWTAIELGIFLAYSSLIMVVVQGPILNWLSKRINSHTLVLIGSLCLAISFSLLTFESIVMLYVANTILSIGNGLMWPSFLSLLSATGTKKTQGTIQGFGTSMGSIASMIGLVMGGILFETITTYTFLMGGGLFLIITILMIVHRYRHKDDLKTETADVVVT
ncbi:MFS transporter [Nonlabens ponticola]|uniref:MFS transporter n=1 Tax=Nonlabens ponticola TaxID=2496866 RepID=A0A3S9N116_9FLAO|nr:MFS transporter [Nonlabens ponticola]AZQ45074.1 MFS transporter [Nonlabens ponticola]